MPDRDNLDEMIDAALESYANPRPGLERRMLARISGGAATSSRWRRLFVAIAAPLIGSLLLMAYLAPRISHVATTQVAVAPTPSSTSHVESTPGRLPASRSASRVHERHARRLPDRVRYNIVQRPKLDIFPSPKPLSYAEKAVIRFAREAPEGDRKALVTPDPELTEPIRITAIHIPPLPSSEEDTN